MPETVMLFFLVSHKGGVGKTTLALALAEYLSRAPRRRKVCILEFDFFGPCLEYLLDFKHRKDVYFNDYIDAWSNGRPESRKPICHWLWEPNMGNGAKRGDVKVLPARPDLAATGPILRYFDIDRLVHFGDEMLTAILSSLVDAGIESVICDFHPGMHGWVSSLLASVMGRENTRARPILCTGQDPSSLVGGLLAGQTVRAAVGSKAGDRKQATGRFWLVARYLDRPMPAYLTGSHQLVRELELQSGKDNGELALCRFKLAVEQAAQLAKCAAVGTDLAIASRIGMSSGSLLAALRQNEQIQAVCSALTGD